MELLTPTHRHIQVCGCRKTRVTRKCGSDALTHALQVAPSHTHIIHAPPIHAPPKQPAAPKAVSHFQVSATHFQRSKRHTHIQQYHLRHHANGVQRDEGSVAQPGQVVGAVVQQRGCIPGVPDRLQAQEQIQAAQA